MKVLVKEKLSPHKSKTPEGYLICRDAILARTGAQEYYASELYPNWGDEDRKISVMRKPEQVFSEQTLASFENKPITVEHPSEDVNSGNIKDYSVGFVRDIRRAKVNGEDVMIGNLVITDAEIVEDIENGIRTELSCGYNCDITDGDDPEQINIRGNHIALCEKGRAGCAKIVDSVTEKTGEYDFYGDDELWKKVILETDGENMSGFSSEPDEDGMRYMTIEGKSKFVEPVLKKLGIRNYEFHPTVGDVQPKKGEKEDEFVGRFMSETKEEYPDQKQRYAVAKSYWSRKNDSEYSKFEWLKSRVESNFYKKPEEFEKVAEYFYNKGLLGDDEWKELEEIYEKRYGVKVTDSHKLPNSIRNYLSKAFGKLSGFTHRDIDISDVLEKIQRVADAVSEEKLEIVRDKINGWYKSKDGTYRKDYYFSFDGYDNQFMVSLYANDDFEVTETNMYFTDCVDKPIDDAVDEVETKTYRGYEIEKHPDGRFKIELDRGEKYFGTESEAQIYIDDFIERARNMLRDRKIKRHSFGTSASDSEYSPSFKRELRKEIGRKKNEVLEMDEPEEDDRRLEFRRMKNKTLEQLRESMKNARNE